MLLLLAAQAAAELADPQAAAFDLRRQPVAPCPAARGDEIVVCGRVDRNERFRLRPLEPRFDERPFRAETTIGDSTLGVGAEQADIGPGLPSKRIMLKLKVPF